MDDRARHLLKSLIEQHISSGHPVGSRQLAKDAGLAISAATVRNVVADLEDAGYVVAPHTSAGRIPTPLGYRFFVDSLIHVTPLSGSFQRMLLQRIGAHLPDAEEVLQATTAMLSELTHLVSFIRVPKRAHQILRHVDFIALRENEVLAIFVTDRGEVENRLLRTESPLSPSVLTQAANFFNASYGGRPLQEVIAQLEEDLLRSRAEMDQILRNAMELGKEMLMADQQGMMVDGELQLLDIPDLADGPRLRELLRTIRQKRELVMLLDGCVQSSSVRLFIGGESGLAPLSDFTLVSAPYHVDGEPVGVIGVLGPLRMPYPEIIPLVDGTARLLGQALSRTSLPSP
ncbi:MAG: heat-inducible transcription repressor HrcA [Acidithiobacillus sp.]|nr:heat-inducible transcription repressor HrcA [Acidithiobacillus sp.]